MKTFRLTTLPTLVWAIDTHFRRLSVAFHPSRFSGWLLSAKMVAGYDTPCGENGVRLSGGQAQRIALARAFLKNAPLLIMDEMTSSLDARTEQSVLESLSRLGPAQTLIFATHRLATVQAADRVIVLQHGQIVGDGSPMELLATNASYQHMMQEMAIDG